MTTKERYHQYIDEARIHAPFTIERVIDLKQLLVEPIPHYCQVCHNKRLRYICQVTDTTGTTWYIGRDCWTELYNRQFEDHPHGDT